MPTHRALQQDQARSPTSTSPPREPQPLAVLTADLVGLLAGAMVLIEVVLVPFWCGLPPASGRWDPSGLVVWIASGSSLI
jgi:hypothetical protein